MVKNVRTKVLIQMNNKEHTMAYIEAKYEEDSVIPGVADGVWGIGMW